VVTTKGKKASVRAAPFLNLSERKKDPDKSIPKKGNAKSEAGTKGHQTF